MVRIGRLLPLSGLLAFLLLTGCRELVQDEFPDFTPVPAVNSYLAADSLIKVHVSLSGKLDTVPLTLVDHATVSCFVNDTLLGNLPHAGNGYYHSNAKAKAGNIYRIQVMVPGFPEITATDTIPAPVKLLAVEHINFAEINEEGYSYPGVRITFPVDRKKTQYFQVMIRDSTLFSSWRLKPLCEFKDPLLLTEGLPVAVFSTGNIMDSTYTLQVDYYNASSYGYNGPPPDYVMLESYYPITVDFISISWHYYQYLKQLHLYNTGRFPDFQFGPYHAFPLYSNVRNAMGIVAGFSVYRSEVIYPEPRKR